mgnify:CR=1 FL=1
MKEVLKGAMLIGIGIGATVANKTMKKVNKELEEMM